MSTAEYREGKLRERVAELESKLAASEEARKNAEADLLTWQHKFGEETKLTFERQQEITALTEERNCWIFNANALQKGYNELDERIRTSQEAFEIVKKQHLLALRNMVEYKQRAEAAEQRIKESQEQEPVKYVDTLNSGFCTVAEDVKLYEQPPIPPELSEVVRERDELRRKLAEQQAIIFNINHPSNLGNWSWADCREKARNSDMTELTKLIEEAKRQAVPEDSVLVKKNFITYGDCLRFGINIDDIRSAAPQPHKD